MDNSVSITSMADWVKDRFGRTDVLVNNASTAYDRWATASSIDLGAVAEAIDVNLFGPWRVIHALLPLLRSSSRPRIVNVSSEGGSIAVMGGGSPAYGVSKAGLNALTRLLAAELARDGILVNAVCPGWPASQSNPDGRSLAQAAASVIWASHHSQRRPQRHPYPGRPALSLVAVRPARGLARDPGSAGTGSPCPAR